MATTPTTIVVYTENKLNLPIKDLHVLVKQIFQYGVKDIVVKGDKILIYLMYSPRTDTLKRKFGNLPIRYIRLRVESEQELKTLERLVKRYKFNILEDDIVPGIEEGGVKRSIEAPSMSSHSKQCRIDDEDYEILGICNTINSNSSDQFSQDLI